MALAGCSLDRGGLREEDAGATPRDAGRADGSSIDAGSLDSSVDARAPIDAFVPDGCTPTPEICNMADDDCDGVPDDGIDLASDAMNCGACGRACGAGQACVRALCVGDVLDLAAGEAFNCAVRRDGAVFCWGNNDSQQLGGPGTSTGTPRQVPGITNAVAVTAGRRFACALLADGHVTCWGENANAELGRGGTSGTGAPAVVPTLDEVTYVTAGYGHTCVLRRAPAELWCWGRSQNGQTGADASGTAHPDPTPSPAQVGMLVAPPTAVEAGGETTCAVLGEALRCWGRDDEGELGAGMPGSSPVPVAVMLPAEPVRSFSVGDRTVCALGGSLRCWGANEAGQIGDGTTMRRTRPVAVSTSITDLTRVDVGYQHTCARRAAGAVACWGSNSAGQIGLGAVGGPNQTVPAEVTGLDGVTKVALGQFHTCALRASGSVACWGDASQGQVGRMGGPQASPVDVPIPPP